MSSKRKVREKNAEKLWFEPLDYDWPHLNLEWPELNLEWPELNIEWPEFDWSGFTESDTFDTKKKNRK